MGKKIQGFSRIQDPDTLNSLILFDRFFQKQLNLIEELAHIIGEENSNLRINQLYPLFDSLLTSGNSLIFLIRHGLVTESYIIARAFLERLV